MAYVNEALSSQLNLVQRFEEFRAQVADTMAKRKVYRTTVNELSALSNRDLADLGIHRSMIKRLALEAAYDV